MEIFLGLTASLNTVTVLIVTALVYFKGKYSKAGKYYFYHLLALSVYSVISMAYSIIPEKYIEIYFKLLYFPTPFLFVFFTHFSLLFVEKSVEYRKFLTLAYILAVFFAVLILSPFFIFGVQIIPGFGFWPIPGVGFYFFIFYYCLALLFPFILLLKFYSKSIGHKRGQARLIVGGTFLGLTGLLPSFLYWYGIYFPPYGFVFITVWICMIAYSIIAYRFMDIKLVLRESFIYFFSLFFTVLIMALLRYFFYNSSSPLNILDIVIFVIGLLIFVPLRRYFYRIANKYFFTSLYDSKNIVSSLSKSLSSTLDIDEIYTYVYEILSSNLRLKSIAILDFDKKKKSYVFSFSKNIQKGKTKNISIDNNLHHQYILKGKTVVFDELYRDTFEYSEKVLMSYNKLNISVLVPLMLKNELIGILALGQKESNDNYNIKDIEVLNVSGSIIATSLLNGYLYKNIHQKSKNLEELLKMKSEFLRIINHQMNTPLSIIKIGFDSLINNTAPKKVSMKTISEGISQMENFLFEYWDAYEFEGKEREMDFEELNLEEIIIEGINKVKNWKVFKEKNLKIRIIKNKIDKTVIGDRKFIGHVISNILENAVYYTNQGGVKISFKKVFKNRRPFLKVLFADTGIGIKNKKKIGLFTKFNRSSEASLYHPNGGGLGLYISFKIMEANNGELMLESTEINKGSVFSISLPIFNK